MRTWAYILFSLILGCGAHAQQIKLQGRLSIHNSKYNTGKIQYVKAAYLTAPFGGAANSDDSGRFELVFVNLDPGTAISITVEKAGLEVVNARDLQQVVIGRRFPLPVYLTTRGQLAKAQTELYNISKQALYAERDAIIQQLRASEAESQAALAALEERFGQELANRFEAEDLLRQQTEELEKRLPEFALALASENLDFANALYIEAFEYYKQGAIDKAIAVLETARLEQSYEEAKANIAEGEKLMATGKTLRETGFLQLNQLISNYDLRATSLLAVFRYHEAAEAYDKIIEIIEENNLENERLDHWLVQAAEASIRNGNYVKALDYGKRAISIQKNNLGPNHLDLSDSYDLVAYAYVLLGDYEKALPNNLKNIAINEANLDPMHPDLATCYNNIANTYKALGDYDKALDYLLKNIALNEVILKTGHPELGTSYNNIAITYRLIGDYKKALINHKRAIAIREEVLNPKHPDLARTYSSTAATYRMFGYYDKALEYDLKAIAIKEEILDPKHPQLAVSYGSIANTYVSLKEYDKALEYNRKDLAITEDVLGPKHPDLAIANDGMAATYRALGDYKKALEYNLKAVTIVEEALDPMHPNVAMTYTSTAITYGMFGYYEKALTYQQKAIEIQKANLDLKHPRLGASYLNMARIYMNMENWSEALIYQNKAIEIIKVALPADHPYQKLARDQLEKITAAIEAGQ